MYVSALPVMPGDGVVAAVGGPVGEVVERRSCRRSRRGDGRPSAACSAASARAAAPSTPGVVWTTTYLPPFLTSMAALSASAMWAFPSTAFLPCCLAMSPALPDWPKPVPMTTSSPGWRRLLAVDLGDARQAEHVAGEVLVVVAVDVVGVHRGGRGVVERHAGHGPDLPALPPGAGRTGSATNRPSSVTLMPLLYALTPVANSPALVRRVGVGVEDAADGRHARPCRPRWPTAP